MPTSEEPQRKLYNGVKKAQNNLAKIAMQSIRQELPNTKDKSNLSTKKLSSQLTGQLGSSVDVALGCISTRPTDLENRVAATDEPTDFDTHAGVVSFTDPPVLTWHRPIYFSYLAVVSGTLP